MQHIFNRLPPRPDGRPNMQRLWYHDLRTNQYFTLAALDPLKELEPDPQPDLNSET